MTFPRWTHEQQRIVEEYVLLLVFVIRVICPLLLQQYQFVVISISASRRPRVYHQQPRPLSSSSNNSNSACGYFSFKGAPIFVHYVAAAAGA